jgi:hypothetical protein
VAEVLVFEAAVTTKTPDVISHIDQIWAARLAEMEPSNAIRLADWQGRQFRDPVPVPPRREVAWLSVHGVESIRRLSA